jgi:DNA polymerase
MTGTLFLDTETFSSVPIKRGHHAYFEAPDAQIMVAAWAEDDGPVHVEDLTEVQHDGSVEVFMPSDRLLHLIKTAKRVVIHNSAFDRRAMSACWGVELEIERVHDTMVQAMAHSLPGALGKLGEIMGLEEDEQKDAEGKKLIQLFCQPRAKKVKIRRATSATHPEEWARFLRYAGMDIPPMRALYRKLPTWNYQGRELALWRLDQRINDRGFLVDVDLAGKAIATIEREQRRLKAETQALTGGDVDSATKRDDLLVHVFVEYGVYLPDLKKDTLERRLEDPEIPDALKQLLRVRLATTTTSTAKYTSVRRSVSRDGRLRGTTAFCGALRTGRWAGRMFQPQNLPRPDMKPEAIVSAIEASRPTPWTLSPPRL